MKFFSDILKIGINQMDPPLVRRSTILFNYLILFCIAIALCFTIITALAAYFMQSIFCFVCSVLLCIPFYLSSKGKTALSKQLLLSALLIMICAGSIINLKNEVFSESENILIAWMFAVMLFLDGKVKNLLFWSGFVAFITLKTFTHFLENGSLDWVISLSILNNGVVAIVSYFFLQMVKSFLIDSKDTIEKYQKTVEGLVDQVPISLALVDTDGTFIIANEKYRSNFKKTKSEVLGKKRSDILSSTMMNEQDQYFKKALAGESITFLHDSSLPDGTIIAANGKYEPLFDKNGKVSSIAICVDDVTELIETQRALKTANETKSRLFSILAHDIKSPLNLFQGLLNMSEEKTLSEKEFLEYQQILKSRLKTLTCTVNELLTWSRLQLEGFTTEPVAVNIYKVAKETINLYKALIEKKKIQLDLICNENIEVMIDENHFKMAFRNLLHNALKYSNSDGTVKIHAQKLGDRCELLIADSGVGMDGATLIAVRNKEIQKSAAGTNHEIGTGIGLSLALGLLEKNECKIELMSEVNQGTTFKISLKTTTDKQRKYPPKAILST